jgi:hypothetical protein
VNYGQVQAACAEGRCGDVDDVVGAGIELAGGGAQGNALCHADFPGDDAQQRFADVKMLGKWHYGYRGVDLDGQVLDHWPSDTHDLTAAEAFFRRTLTSTGCVPKHIVIGKATFCPSAIRTLAPDAKHTATGFYNRVISTNRYERNHGYLKSRLRPKGSLRSVDCAKRLLPWLVALQVIEGIFVPAMCTGAPHASGRSYERACNGTSIVDRLGQRL